MGITKNIRSIFTAEWDRANLYSRRGFSLLEMIIVMALVSVLFLGLLTSFFQMERLMSSQKIAADKSQNAINLMKMLSADLQNIVYEKWNIKDSFFLGKKEIVGGTRVDFLNFPTGSLYSNPSTLQSNVFSVAYYGKIDDNTGILNLYRREDIFISKIEESAGVGVPIIQNVKAFEVQYSTNSKTFDDEWDSALKSNTFPNIIKVRLVWEENDQEREFTFESYPPILSQ
ncbi:MAG: prepilin-type N-terminal cleavage/methylation domain-containing protein [Spirochaetia bacterium]|nr:prepilin-type N-terminal cleavage/methylation domain-containing protein [Spirochaetia bacterium]